MDSGWRPVPQRLAEVCSDLWVIEGQSSCVCGGHVTALDHHGVFAEVGECTAWARGQTEDPTWGNERDGAEE